MWALRLSRGSSGNFSSGMEAHKKDILISARIYGGFEFLYPVFGDRAPVGDSIKRYVFSASGSGSDWIYSQLCGIGDFNTIIFERSYIICLCNCRALHRNRGGVHNAVQSQLSQKRKC